MLGLITQGETGNAGFPESNAVAAMKPYEERKARERIEAGKGSDGSGGRGNSKTLAPIGAGVSDVGRVTEKLAEKAGVGRRTVERAIKVREQGTPELNSAVARKSGDADGHRGRRLRLVGG